MNKLRSRILQKFAQAATPTNLPTEEANKTKTVSGSPRAFQASNLYPTIITGFSAKNIPLIDQLSNIINQSLFYTSNGEVDLIWMKENNFNVGTTSVPSEVLKNLMNFSKQIYQQLYNSGQEYKKQLTPEEIKIKIDFLKYSTYLSNLPASNPIGQLSAKIGGNVKTLITNLLTQIK